MPGGRCCWPGFASSPSLPGAADMDQLMRRTLELFALATLMAAIVTLVGFLLSRDTGFAEFFDQNWELVLLATGVLILGLIVTVAGVVMFYSVAGAFSPTGAAVGLLIIAAGLALLILGGSVVLELGAPPIG